MTGARTTYTYNTADRLTGVTTTGTGGKTFTYSYDARGNRLTPPATAPAPPRPSPTTPANQISTAGYTHDGAQGNRYAYAADNPVNNVDPTGRMSDEEAQSIGAALVGGVAGLIVGGVVFELAGPVAAAAAGGCVAGAVTDVLAVDNPTVSGAATACVAGAVAATAFAVFIG